mgnify:CR=1 FL=1
MENYPSNSHKAREEVAEKKVEKVVSGKTSTKKKSGMRKLSDTFLSEDVSNVKSYIFSEVLLPAAKKLVSDIVTNGIDMLLYGEIRKVIRLKFLTVDIMMTDVTEVEITDHQWFVIILTMMKLYSKRGAMQKLY